MEFDTPSSPDDSPSSKEEDLIQDQDQDQDQEQSHADLGSPPIDASDDEAGEDVFAPLDLSEDMSPDRALTLASAQRASEYDEREFSYSAVCITCSYDLTGLAPEAGLNHIACPECGAENRPRTSAKKKRVRISSWPVVLTAILTIPAAVMVSGVVIGLVLALGGQEELLQSPVKLQEWMMDLGKKPGGLLLLLMPVQLTFLVAALIGTKNAPEPFRKRLGFEKSRLPRWTWVLFMLATPAVGLISYLLFPFLQDDPGEALKQVQEMITAPQGIDAIIVVLAVSLLPGFCEEIFFRGFVQQRLQRNWGPTLGILFAAVTFAAAHVDPHHAIAVLPIGIWLGIVAWKSGCIWPAICCHVFNNFYASVVARLGWDQSAGMSDGFVIGVNLVTLVLPVMALCWAVGFLTPLHWWQSDEKIEAGATMPSRRMWAVMTIIGVLLSAGAWAVLSGGAQ